MPIVEFVTLEGRRLLINARREATSILVNNELALNFDCKGRLTGAWIDGRNYRRSLDNRILQKQGGPRGGLSYRLRRELDPEEARQFQSKVHDLLAEYSRDVHNPGTRIANSASAGDRELVFAALEGVLSCDLERLEAEAEAFHRIYRPISILPPDQYLALVLQATEGCSYNRCAFCGFYRDRGFRIKTLAEFKQHLDDVRTFFGSAINLRKTIFVADANALVIPQRELLPIMDMICNEFAIDPPHLDHAALSAWRAEHPIHFEGIYSFVDAFTTRRKTARNYAELSARGLRRVYVGLESGDAALLRFLGKPNSPDEVVQLVRQVKAGGVAVGIIILAGAGGEKYAAPHVLQTAEIVNAMPLDENDLIYFSELVDYPGSSYSELAQQAGIRPLTVEGIEEQMRQMRAGFRFRNDGHVPKVSYYDVREFIY
jgi:hypothetical protein